MTFSEILNKINHRLANEGKPLVSIEELIITISVMAAQQKIIVEGDNVYKVR